MTFQNIVRFFLQAHDSVDVPRPFDIWCYFPLKASSLKKSILNSTKTQVKKLVSPHGGSFAEILSCILLTLIVFHLKHDVFF